MSLLSATVHQNRLLSSLPEEERVRIARRMEPLEAPVRTELIGPGGGEEYVYFPSSGLISIVAATQDGEAVECGAVGAEGFVGVPLFAGMLPSNTVVVQQIAGTVMRLRLADFGKAAEDAPVFAHRLTLFGGTLLAAAMQTAACNRLHDPVARCARWLHFTHERVERRDLPLTHEFIGQMLGASRSGVTAAIGTLETEGVIERSRGQIFVRDAHRLAGLACECHGVIREVYQHYLAALGQPAREPALRA